MLAGLVKSTLFNLAPEAQLNNRYEYSLGQLPAILYRSCIMAN